MRDFLHAHGEKIMEMGVLVFIFVFACVMLAIFKGNEELSRWIENGSVIAILARAFGSHGTEASIEPAKEPPKEP